MCADLVYHNVPSAETLTGVSEKEPWKGPAAPVFEAPRLRGHSFVATSFAVSPPPASTLHREAVSDSGFALAGPPLDGKTRCPGRRRPRRRRGGWRRCRRRRSPSG